MYSSEDNVSSWSSLVYTYNTRSMNMDLGSSDEHDSGDTMSHKEDRLRHGQALRQLLHVPHQLEPVAAVHAPPRCSYSTRNSGTSNPQRGMAVQRASSPEPSPRAASPAEPRCPPA